MNIFPTSRVKFLPARLKESARTNQFDLHKDLITFDTMSLIVVKTIHGIDLDAFSRYLLLCQIHV